MLWGAEVSHHGFGRGPVKTGAQSHEEITQKKADEVVRGGEGQSSESRDKNSQKERASSTPFG